MNARLYLSCLAAGSLLAAAPFQLAAEPVKVAATLRLDEHGDGTLEVQEHLAAIGWRIWEEVYGNHPDLILRNMKRQYASSQLDGTSYHLDKDELNRNATAHLHALAIAALQKDGSLAIALPKPISLVSHTGPEWIFDYNIPPSKTFDGSEQIFHVILPVGESEAHIQYPESADQQLVFRVRQSGAGQWLLLLGILAGVVGVVLVGASAMVSKQNPPAMAGPVKPA
jgi:hypothetical protein